jgi:hypothetical protein
MHLQVVIIDYIEARRNIMEELKALISQGD